MPQAKGVQHTIHRHIHSCTEAGHTWCPMHDLRFIQNSPGVQGEGGRKGSSGRGTDMEVSFTPGLEGLGARLLAQKKQASQRKGDTVWEAYLRRQK